MALPRHPNRPLRACALSLLAAAALAACGGGGDAGPNPNPPTQPLACVELPQITWQASATAAADWNDVLVDRRNRIWLAGWAEGEVGRERLDPSGNSRAVVRQLDSDGRVLWDSGAEFDSPGTDVAEALALGADGRLYVAGRTTGTLDGRANAGQFDAFVAWADGAAPATPWQRLQTGTERPEHPRRLALAPSGDLHLAGWDDEFVPSNFVAAWQDPIALRFSRQGAGLTQAWRYQGDSVVPDIADGLAVDAAGHTYLGGSVQSGAQRGMFLRKLDAEGRALWTARYTSLAVDHIAAVQLLPDGHLLVAGTVYGSFRGNTHFGEQDVFVARVAADDGRVLASWQFGGTGSEWLTDMKIDAQGRILLLGETDGSVVPGQANAGAADLFMLQLDVAGQLLARTQWGTAADEQARRLAADSCGRVVATGASGREGAAGPQRAGVLWFWRP
ncbi:MAG: hypothetical protein JNJ71_18870 [Rubrivivax sp.]|nr:hypothetical protein [Rubrivivax sp.]